MSRKQSSARSPGLKHSFDYLILDHQLVMYVTSLHEDVGYSAQNRVAVCMVVPPSVKRVSGYSVRRISVFSCLPDMVLKHLNSTLTPSSGTAGEILYAQNEKPTGLYVLFQGRVKLTAVVATGKTALLRISAAGDLLGLNAVMAQHPYMATARLLTECRLAFIAREDLVSLMIQHSELGFVISQRLAKDCAQALTEMLFLRVTTSSLQRLAMLLLRWSTANGARHRRLPVLYTQAEIGQMIGASRETVTRLMNQLERDGDISFSRSKLKILNERGMRKIAQMS